MNVVLSTTSKFNFFDLARQLERRGFLQCIFSGYPLQKLKNEHLPLSKIRSLPWVSLSYHAVFRLTQSRKARWAISWFCNQGLDAYTAAFLPEADVFQAVSANGLRTGRKIQHRGGVYICDRPCSHIRYQDAILREEYQRYGLQFEGVDPRVIAKEEAEYALADAVVVGSTFARRSFLEMGVPEAKVHLISYGVDLSRFHPTGEPPHDTFQVLFVGAASIRKGIGYLLQSFADLQHPNKQLTFAGTIMPEAKVLIDKAMATLPITCLGHVPQTQLKELMSQSHVLILPSVEEGLAYVQAQAMACGCPVIASTNTGSEDLFEDGIQGFIVPIRDPKALTDRMQRLADDPEMRRRMSAASLERVKEMGGWDKYGESMITLMADLVAAKVKKSAKTLQSGMGQSA